MIGRRVMNTRTRATGVVRGEYPMTAQKWPAAPSLHWFYAVELDDVHTLDVWRHDEVQAIDWLPA